LSTPEVPQVRLEVSTPPAGARPPSITRALPQGDGGLGAARWRAERPFVTGNFLHEHHDPAPQGGIINSHERSDQPQADLIGDEVINLGHRRRAFTGLVWR